MPIHVPSLRERTEDIPLLVANFLRENAGDGECFQCRGTGGFGTLHLERQWAELENAVERLLILRKGNRVEVGDLPEKLRSSRAEEAAGGFSFCFPAEGFGLEEAERALSLEALRRTGWNQNRAAKLLKIERHILLYRLGMSNFSVR